tara:strand:- start:1492 stop:2532 length:1041 start_codon:yes stop_codon:yes gene_type:complete
MKCCIIFTFILLWSGCANIVPPSGGPKDNEMPILISAISEYNEDYSEKNIIFEFNERIEEHLFIQNFYSSPPLKEITHHVNGKELDIKITENISPDIKYIIKLNNCIKDITEGNILNKLEYVICPKDTTINFFHLKVMVENSLTKQAEENHWVLLYDRTISDSLIFKTNPSYVSKTNQDGLADFNNLKKGKYKIISLSGDDYAYHEEDIISFSNNMIIAGEDTIVKLFTFDPLYKKDSSKTINDTIVKNGGKITIKSDFKESFVVQLLKENKIYIQEHFEGRTSFTLKNIPKGEYNLRVFYDKNGNFSWDTGSWEEKRQAESMHYYVEKITIRENWDLELDWIIQE